MPVEGDHSAALQARRGSIACASAALSGCTSTPLARARSCRAASAACCAGEVATTSLPQRRCATPCSSQKAYSASRPVTHQRALREPSA